MSSVVLEEAFPTWKMLDELVDTLLKPGSVDKNSVQTLANMVMSKEFLRTFIYTKEPGITFEAYEIIVDQYRSFTTWLVGRFLHLLICQDNQILVEAQLSIMDELTRSSVHVYSHLAEEFLKTFNLLCNYLKSPQDCLKISVFEPKQNDELNKKLILKTRSIEINNIKMCSDSIRKILRIIEYVLVESITFFSFEPSMLIALNNMILLLKRSQFELDLFKIFLKLLKRLHYNIDNLDVKIINIFKSFLSLFEQFFYDFYTNLNTDNNASVDASEKDLFDDILFQCLQESQKLKGFQSFYQRISLFIIKSILESDTEKKVLFSKEIVILCTNKICDNITKLIFLTKNNLNTIVLTNNSALFNLLKPHIFKELHDYLINNSNVRNVWALKYSSTWKIFCNELNLHWTDLKCDKICPVNSRVEFFIDICSSLFEIKIQLMNIFKNGLNLYFFDGNYVIPEMFSYVARHISSCKFNNSALILKLLIKILYITDCKNLDIFFHLIVAKWLINFSYKNLAAFPNNYIGDVVDSVKFKSDILLLYKSLGAQLSDLEIMEYLNAFLKLISSGLMKNNNNKIQMDEIEFLCLKILVWKKIEEFNILCQIIDSIPHFFHIFTRKDDIINNIFLPLLAVKNINVQQKILEIIPKLICTSFNEFTKEISTDKIRILCTNCSKKCSYNDSSAFIQMNFAKIKLDNTMLFTNILKTVITVLISSNDELKSQAILAMPSLSRHFKKFNTPDVAKIWIEAAGDAKVDVRISLKKIIRQTVQNALDYSDLHKDIKSELLQLIFVVLLKLSKKSLKFSEYPLQDTLVETIGEISGIDDDGIKLECLKIFLYFIMIPTSQQSFIALSKCMKLSKKDSSGQMVLYKYNTEEICSIIAHLCYCNQYIIQASLQESLISVAVMLGFEGVKDFLTKEAKKLLPHLVEKTVKNQNVHKLIQDMASIINMEIGELLKQNYGNIFLHLSLGDMEISDYKKCLSYLETSTKLSGAQLRKLSIRVILNKLLLNFHEKRDKVLETFRLLKSEDNNPTDGSIEEYIQPYFLPFLLYFDLEFTSPFSRHELIILSLADLFKYLGPTRIIPLRFKIIAMLQTPHYQNYPQLTCSLWEAFIQSCDIEVLGAHLATIFTSLLPLIEKVPNNVNKIFHYLLVENERYLNDFIVDLFFVNNSLISSNILQIIKNHLKAVENLPFKELIQRYLKYLKHDTMEVRMQSLKQIKKCLEINRVELDQMILAYNGIDDVIVELIDYLTLGCREKDVNLKLACGEVFGQLGAIEPSHLPRRCVQASKTFIFFVDEDGFIEGALIELIKAFQTDKNARNTDRVALAIQEILKTYKISPEETSERNFMWNKFSDSQKEVMTPLLSSKYICVENFTGYSCPVYGTKDGSNFLSWLYNWTSSIINTLSIDKRIFLQSCFPSMKLDKRVLMHFLPYILLHSLLEGSNANEERIYLEFETILNDFKTKQSINPTVLKDRPLPMPGLEIRTQEITTEEKKVKCIKIVFILLDFLKRWLRELQWYKGPNIVTDCNYQNVKRFLDKFCKMELAKCNYKCGEYARALLYLENYITEQPNEMISNLQFLGEIYVYLDESDGVLGVEKLQESEPSLEQKLLPFLVAGKFNDVAAVYEHMPRPLKLEYIQGLIHCYLDLDKVSTALYCADGFLESQPELSGMLVDMQAEALWRLGSYDDLNDLLEKSYNNSNKSWSIQVGKSLLSIKKGDRNEFKEVVTLMKKQQIELFGAASLEEGAYHHGYTFITRLHCITELEQLEKLLFDLFLKHNNVQTYAEECISKLSQEWQLRLKVVQESTRVVNPLLCLRRVALSLARNIAGKKAPQAVSALNKMLGETWLQSIVQARSAGILQQAYTYVLDAEKFNPPNLFIEKAKLHWLREEHEEALITLKRGLNLYIPDGASSQEVQNALLKLNLEEKKICSEAKLLIATYNNDICSVDVEINLQQYKDAVEVYKESEKNFVCLAQYHDRILQNYTEEQKDTKAKDLQLHIVYNFGRSLNYGTNFIYQSMPRLLSIWFDYGTRFANVSNNAARDERKDTLVKMTKVIDSFSNNLPAFVFLTSFSQIISRIAHPQKEVYVQLKTIIVNLIHHYPQQCLWMISSVIKSSYPIRAKRCAEILNDKRLKIQALSRLIHDFTSLAEKLIELCNKEIPTDVANTTVSSLVRSLPKLFTKNFSEIMMPTHKFRKLILPNPEFKKQNNTDHNPFPNQYVHIVGIDNDVTILASLQRPRKINLRGSDGKSYAFMLKPKDDLRRDFRLMEFNDVVNHLLLRDPEARQRRLNIRLYSVAPLNEECGLIEWVHDLIGLRPILMTIYKKKGIGMRPKEVKEVCCNIRDPIAKKREVFTNILLKRHPPVLGEWFRKIFPDPQTWLTARTAYIRTTAVISITGYMLGLGDRHGENILLDSTCGDVVQVDFNCLFNKGETFEWPERVPFRLTHNMIAAMGPLGVEGVFRKSCEFTLRVLRSNTATLMSIVTPFVYDPLVSWNRNVPIGGQGTEKVNEQALEHIKNIELRLQGKVKTRNRAMSQCLSIEGQIDYLINEAKSVDNLCQMYIGWGPYL